MAPDVINSEECAQLLRATKEQVEEMARAGELPALKISRSWIFMRADLLVFLAEKARVEAEARRSKRQAGAALPMVAKLRRQVPPVLPTLPSQSRRP